VLDAAGFSESRSLDGIDRVIEIARANLDGQRNLDRLLNLFQDSFEARVIAQETRAAAVLDDLRRGAAAVNIQDIRANLFSHLRSHPHPLRLPAENLHRERSLLFKETHLPFRL